MQNIIETKFKKFSWLNITDNSEAEIRYLRDKHNLNDSHLLDCAAPPLRPKIELAHDYVFIILLFPIYDHKTKKISVEELDVFIKKDIVITIHKNGINELKEFAQKIEALPEFKLNLENEKPLTFFAKLLEPVVLSLYPMLNHLSWDIDNIDTQLFKGQERELIARILGIKKNIFDFRKAMQSHKNVLADLLSAMRPGFSSADAEKMIRNVIEHYKNIWDQLENHKDTINAIQQTNESLISFRLSYIMKTLTIFSVIVFPLTLLAAIFGMNTVQGMPFINSPGGFWKVMGIMAVGTVLMFIYFKKNKWI